MSDEQIRQRIAYLVEHGGLYDDPQEELRRQVSFNRKLAVAAFALVAFDVLIDVTLFWG